MLERRPRHSPVPSGKSIAITSRDIRTFSLLSRYRFLDTDTLVAFCEPRSRKRYVERLGNLFHETALLDRPWRQWTFAKAFQTHCIYSLSHMGIDWLASRSVHIDRAIIADHLSVSDRTHQFQHSVAASLYVARQEIELGASLHMNKTQELALRFVPVEEIARRRTQKAGNEDWALAIPTRISASFNLVVSPKHLSVIPDALFAIEYDQGLNKGYRFFAIEIERTTPLRRRTLAKSSTLKKLLAYQGALRQRTYKSALGVPNLFPVFVARDKMHRQAITSLAEQILHPDELALFRFDIMDKRFSDHLVERGGRLNRNRRT